MKTGTLKLLFILLLGINLVGCADYSNYVIPGHDPSAGDPWLKWQRDHF